MPNTQLYVPVSQSTWQYHVTLLNIQTEENKSDMEECGISEAESARYFDLHTANCRIERLIQKIAAEFN